MIVAKPTTPGRRGLIKLSNDQITTKKPVKRLLKPRKQKSGRNNQGRITVRRRGGGAKRKIRLISWSLPDGFIGKVCQIEYDPNRSANLARLEDQSTKKLHYILAPEKVAKGFLISVGPDAPIRPGNRLPLSKIPLGTVIHNIELYPGRGGQLARGAGNGARLVAIDDKFAQIKLPSREVRLVDKKGYASIGVVGNSLHRNIKLSKAGHNRWRGRRPKVRGVAMNAVDHPHGGGEAKGKNYKWPTSPWGQKTIGYKTRSKRKSNKLIVRNRHLSRRKK